MIPFSTIESLAQDFWISTKLTANFPRPIEQGVSRALPITIVKLPAVTVRHVRSYLAQQGIDGPFPMDTRDLMGCLFAFHGNGIIFVCGADEPSEQRFTIAHDTAHFILDYLRPRHAVIDAIGPSALEVLDGLRMPTHIEQCEAVFRGVHIGPHLHLLPRQVADSHLFAVENSADRLGLELMAPRSVLGELMAKMRNYAPGHLAQVLAEYFGLPMYILHAAFGIISPPPSDNFLNRLEITLETQSGNWKRRDNDERE